MIKVIRPPISRTAFHDQDDRNLGETTTSIRTSALRGDRDGPGLCDQRCSDRIWPEDVAHPAWCHRTAEAAYRRTRSRPPAGVATRSTPAADPIPAGRKHDSWSVKRKIFKEIIDPGSINPAAAGPSPLRGGSVSVPRRVCQHSATGQSGFRGKAVRLYGGLMSRSAGVIGRSGRVPPVLSAPVCRPGRPGHGPGAAGAAVRDGGPHDRGNWPVISADGLP